MASWSLVVDCIIVNVIEIGMLDAGYHNELFSVSKARLTSRFSQFAFRGIRDFFARERQPEDPPKQIVTEDTIT